MIFLGTFRIIFGIFSRFIRIFFISRDFYGFFLRFHGFVWDLGFREAYEDFLSYLPLVPPPSAARLHADYQVYCSPDCSLI